eukprot:jgi/Ulvmu1/4797/UM020_0082.1
MGNLLSYSKSQSSRNKALQVTDTDKAILDIRIARKQLVTYRSQQEQLAERSQNAVGDLLAASKRDRAKLALKKKKLHEAQAIQIDRYILKLDEQVVALETTAQQVDTVDALRTANRAIKSMQKQMPLEEIEQLMDETAEANTYMEQVNTMLAVQHVDVTGLDEELDALEAEALHEDIATMPTALTTAPADTVSVTAQGEPHVHVRLEGHGDSAGVSFEVSTSPGEAEFPAAPAHTAFSEIQAQGEDSQDAELIPA